MLQKALPFINISGCATSTQYTYMYAVLKEKYYKLATTKSLPLTVFLNEEKLKIQINAAQTGRQMRKQTAT